MFIQLTLTDGAEHLINLLAIARIIPAESPIHQADAQSLVVDQHRGNTYIKESVPQIKAFLKQHNLLLELPAADAVPPHHRS